MIELDRLSIGFPSQRGMLEVVVRDLTISLTRGERVGVVGESGSGKSLAALACLGLAPEPGRMVGGTVTINGTDLESISDGELRRWRGGTVGMVFQEASSALNPVYSVGFQLEEAIRCHRTVDRIEARRNARDLLHRVAIDDAERIRCAYPHELSGGLAQRVMLALALAGNPSLLIADEPTSSLDSVTRAEILGLLDDLVRDRGLGLLLVSHDLTVVRDTVDRIIVMYGGEIMEQAPTSTLFEDPRHPYSRMLLSSTIHEPDRTPEAGRGPVPRQNGGRPIGCVFAARCGLAVPECSQTRPDLIELNEHHRLRCPVVAAPTEAPREQS